MTRLIHVLAILVCSLGVTAGCGVTQPWTADAGADQNVPADTLVTLRGSGSPGSLAFLWTFKSVPAGSAAALSDPTAKAPSFTADAVGTYVVSLLIRYEDGSAEDTVRITAAGNAAPVADAGSDQNVTTGALVTLDGSASSDANLDPLTYAWSFTSVPSGSTAALDDPTAEAPTFTADLDGAYDLSLVVHDGTVASVPDTMTVTAASGNTAPVADAGSNQNATTGSLVTLDGTGSSDADLDPLTYAWSFTSVPSGSTAALDDPTAEAPTFTADLDGAYDLSLVVDDGTTASAPDTVTVTAAAATTPSAAVVYRAVQDVASDIELYVGSLSGAATIQLNAALVAGGDIFSWLVSSDGATVVYSGDQDVDGEMELYSVPIGGGTAVQLNGALPVGGRVGKYAITPDSNTVIYQAEQDTLGKMELYAVPIGGGATTRLDGFALAGGDVGGGLYITPDSATVVYTGDLDTDNLGEVYAAPIDGSAAALKISGAFGDVTGGLQMNAAGTRVVYRADPARPNRWEAFSALVNGGGAVRLHTPITSGQIYAATISADGSTTVYSYSGDVFSVPIAGGTPVKLNNVVSGWSTSITTLAISPDSSTVVYQHDQNTDNLYELFSVPIGGGTPIKLNGALVANGTIWDFKISPDSSTVLFHGDASTDGIGELYAVPIGGGTSVKLNGAVAASGDGVTADFLISADSTTVLYSSDRDTAYVLELYAVPIGGGTSVELNGTLAAGGNIDQFRFANDGTTVIYRADQDVDNDQELYAVPRTGGTPVKINGALVAGGDVVGF